MTAQPIRKIVIVGGGTAGWMAAAGISRVMGQFPGLSIELVESEAIGTVGVGEATVPQIRSFNTLLGIDEAEFVRETHATYKLGIEFVDWLRPGHSYVHPFGSYGLDMLGIEFHHFWLHGRAADDPAPLDEYSIGAMAGKAGRYFPPQLDNPKSPLSKLAYAFQFDATRYARYLRARAERQGVVRHEGRIVDVLQDADSGFVTAVRMEDGREIGGELFIDCSGFRSLLLGQTLGVPFIDWTGWLPCDRAVAIPCELGGDSQPLTRATAREAGWQWRIPLQHRIGNGLVYSSAHMDDEAALDLLLANLDGKPLAEPNRLRFAAGLRERPWEKNVVALGLAAGFLEPLESTSIQIVQASIARLMALFPDSSFGQAEIRRFNADSVRDMVDIRDMLVLHYLKTEREGELWRACRAVDPPDGLAHKLEMFESSGRIFRENNEFFTEPSWLAVMVGQGVEPARFHPLAMTIGAEETRKRLAHIREVIASTVAQMPTQDRFLAEQGSAIPASERLTA
ncbi:tryptophan halogenase family protein [Alteriqipengyuania lutimaris]|uniref:Tryptophan 7-halogenase n=1 Tax=Alteriqipengyuania lutimaris TaxID=1538146 RepID=A0A395LK73_9SPHN|nr:tryptophan halogenase family protein [Alteriqipengyuania lutimaris]MBB3033682.1 tryptophan halogenase [Alteriqipengyuania lutimaris]RDS77332.1 tryptophan 7-halogenase [Alteriqipengyuania lutimaris]